MRKYFIVASLFILAGCSLLFASIYAPGGFLHQGYIQFGDGNSLKLHRVCDTVSLRVVYVLEDQIGPSYLAVSDTNCTIPDDTPNN